MWSGWGSLVGYWALDEQYTAAETTWAPTLSSPWSLFSMLLQYPDLLLHLNYCAWFIHNFLEVISPILRAISVAGSGPKLLQVWMGTFPPSARLRNLALVATYLISLCGGHIRKIWLSFVFPWRTQFFSSQKEDGSLTLGLSRDFRSWSPGWSGLLNYLKIVSDLIL